MKYQNLDVLFRENLLVGESPVWDERKKELCFVDIRGKCFYHMDYLTGRVKKTDVSELIGCLALCDDGNLLISMESGIYQYSAKNDSLLLAHQKTSIKGERFNDGKVGPDGYYYVGTAGQNFSGAFYRLKDGYLQELFDGCGCSNGIDWTADGKTMYYCDSRTQKLEKFDFSMQTHLLSGRTTISKIPPSLGCGDGLAADENGNVWLAVWGGSRVMHINAKSGSVIEEIEIPASQVSSCCFAGDDLRDLIITTASVRLDTANQPMAGHIFRYRTSVPGLRFNRYNLEKKKKI